MGYRGGQTRIPFDVDVARGEINGLWGIVHKFGENTSIATAYEDVWDGGGDYTGWRQSASTMRIAAGGNINDVAGGSGATSVTIGGLDENWNEVTETVATAGAGASLATTTTFIRVSRCWVAGVGVYGGSAAATITIEAVADAAIMAAILIINAQTQMAIYTVPAGCTGLVSSIGVSVDTGKTADVRWYQRQNADDILAPMSAARVWHSVTGISAPYYRKFESFPTFEQKTDLWVRALTGTAGGAPVQADFCLLLTPTRVA